MITSQVTAAPKPSVPDLDFPTESKHFGMSSEEYYTATQRQREIERRVRKTKGEIANLERAGLGLESPVYVQKRLVLGKQQRTLAEHCADKKLVRQSKREKAYSVKEQPRALRKKPAMVRAGGRHQKAWLEQFEPEELWVHSATGELLHYAKGEVDGVAFPSMLKSGATFSGTAVRHTHTTTIGGTFSKSDIEATMDLDFAKHTVVATLERRVFTLVKTTRATKELQQAFKRDFEKVEDSLYESLSADYWEEHLKTLELPLSLSDRRKIDGTLKVKTHAWLKENARRYGYKYSSRRGKLST